MNLLDQLRVPFSQVRVLTDSLTDAVIYTDRNFAIVYINTAAEKMFGVSLSAVQGNTVDEIVSYELQGHKREEVFTVLRNRSSWAGDAFLVQKGGRKLQLKVNVTLVRNEAGFAENILIVGANVTVTKEALGQVTYLAQKNEDLELAHKQLQQVQQQFEAFMQHSSALTWIVDAVGKFVFANDLWRKTFGTEGSEPIQLAGFTPGLTQVFHKSNQRVLSENASIEELEPAVLPSGESRLFQVYKFPIKNINGQTLVGGIALDVTEHAKRQTELQISNERFRHVINATSDAIWDWDIEADVVYRGEGFKKLFGADLETAPMVLRNTFVHPEERERVALSLVQALESGAEHWQEEYRFLCLDGQYKICVDRASILRNSSGKAIRVIGAMQDVTRQRELEAELRCKEAQRRQAISKAVIEAQERERFEISFELHEQISQTLTTCNLLLSNLDCNQHQDRLEFCRKLLRDSINGIRNISHRINPGTLDIVGLTGALENFIHNMGNEEKLQIELKTSGIDDAKLLSPSLQLAAYRVVQEQLNNISKHAQATNAFILLEVRDNKLMIEITDDGQGFDPHCPTDGLGLANIQHRAELHQGEMSIQSLPGQGTRLRVVLPLGVRNA